MIASLSEPARLTLESGTLELGLNLLLLRDISIGPLKIAVDDNPFGNQNQISGISLVPG